MYACSGILFNHESEYRGKEFVTQKVVEKAVSIYKGDVTTLVLGILILKEIGDMQKIMFMACTLCYSSKKRMIMF